MNYRVDQAAQRAYGWQQLWRCGPFEDEMASMTGSFTLGAAPATVDADVEGRSAEGLVVGAVASSSRVVNVVARTVLGSEQDDVLVGTAGDDVLCALGGNDRLHGLGGDDLLIGCGQ